MFIDERHDEILRLLSLEGRVHVRDLAERFHVSPDSIRRDLSILEDKGQLRRIHGGAVQITKVRMLPRANELRYGEGTAQDNAIAKCAASYIGEGDTVFVGHASLHYTLLHHLPDNLGFTVVTNSVVIANVLRERTNIETYMICGRVKPSGSVTDATAIEYVKNLKFDAAFIVGAGLTASRGVSTATPEAALFHRAVVEHSTRTLCLSNYAKLGNEAFSQIVPIHDIDVVITDWDARQQEIEKIRLCGLDVVVTQPSSDTVSC